MYSILSRANALLAFTLWVMAAVTAVCFLSTAFLDYSAQVDVDVKDVKVRSVVDYASGEDVVDLATLSFSIKADFTKVFNWNVKQLFVFLVAEYESKNNALNQFVVWDRIIERSERVLVEEHESKPKYYFLDDGSNLLNHQNVTFVLRYNVVPNSGYLRLAQSSNQISVKFPAQYSTKRR